MRKSLLMVLVAVICLALLASGCAPEAQEEAKPQAEEKAAEEAVAKYPERPIQLVIPYKPGGATDIIFRLVCKYAEKHLGQPIVCVNMPGATSTVGSRHVKEARPDGYTLLGSHDVIATAFYSGVVDYAFEAFEPICLITSTPNIATTHSDYPWNTMKELLEEAKSKPGEIVWSTTFGSTDHFFILGILEAAGVSKDVLRLVGYEGTGPQLTALLGKHTHGCMANVASAMGHVEAGDLKFLGVAWESRLPQIPDVPTLKEQGIDFAHATNRGVFAPKGTPEGILKKIEEAFRKAMEDPECKAKIEEMGTLVNFKPREEYVKFLDELMKKYDKLAQMMK